MRLIAISTAALSLAACANQVEPMPPASPAPPAEIDYTCNAAAAQGHIGHDATQGMGAAIQRDAGAGTLRWGPPRSAWTMDYRKDRVNVRYDDKMKITEITCG